MDNIEKFIQEFGGLTEEYSFYNGEIFLRYDPVDHVYLLVKEDGSLEPVSGVTSTCHIIDKSLVLIPWACKMMSQKLSINLQFYYKPDGTLVDGLTRDVLETLITQAKTAHKDKLEEAGNIGHIAHAWIEQYINAIISKDQTVIDNLLWNMPYDDKARSACNAALTWMKNHNVNWISTERKIYSRKYKYAGTMDGLAWVDSCTDPFCCPNPFKRRLAIIDWKTSNYLYPEYLMQTASYEAAYEEETGEDVEDRWIIRLNKEDAKFETWHLEEECFEPDFAAFLAALDLRTKFDAIEQRLVDLKDIYRKGKKAKKVADLANACKNSVKYKGIRYPTCNGGNPCKACLEKYEAHQVEKAAKAIKEKKPKKVKLTHEQIVKNLQNLVNMS
jgi:hypothetical protein